MLAPEKPNPSAEVHDQIQGLLARSAAFQALPAEAQQRLAADMAKVGGFLAQDREWLKRGAPARAQDAVESLKQRLAKEPDTAGKNFRAGAMREGAEVMSDFIQKVDFNKFVGGLIHNVFQAVVDASIQQMQAYGELLAATAKTVDQFASDHITDAQARDYVANRFPSSVEVDTSSGAGARLKPKEGGPEVDLGAALGTDSVDVNDEEGEQQLVNAAKLELARQRQQLLATMVLLGINRIVVTNGHINAKVLFDMRSSDKASVRNKAQMEDVQKSRASAGTGWLGSVVGGFDVGTSHETTVGSSIDEASDSRAQLKAQLSGDVRLAFKSETFPLERMVDVMGLQSLNQKAAPVSPQPRVAPQAPAAPAASPTAGGVTK